MTDTSSGVMFVIVLAQESFEIDDIYIYIYHQAYRAADVIADAIL
jgi:hypothetical protein